MGYEDWLIPGASVIGALANVGSTMATNAYNLQNSREQRAFERQQWMMQTAYNHPKAQMERLMSAGLNPNLAMGDSGNMSNQPSFTGPSQAVPPQIDPMLLSQIELNNAQAENLRADAEVKRVNVDESKSRIDLNHARIDEIETNVAYVKLLSTYQHMQNDAAFVTDYFEKYYSSFVTKLRSEGSYYSSLNELKGLEADAKFLGNIIGYLEKMYEITGVFPVITNGVIKEFEHRFGEVSFNDGTPVKEWKAWDPYLKKLDAILKKDVISNEVDGALVLLHGALANLYGEESKLTEAQRRYISLNTLLMEVVNFVDYDEKTGQYSISVGGEVYTVGKDALKALGQLLGFDFTSGKRSTTVTRTPSSR